MCSSGNVLIHWQSGEAATTMRRVLDSVAFPEARVCAEVERWSLSVEDAAALGCCGPRRSLGGIGADRVLALLRREQRALRDRARRLARRDRGAS